MKIKVSIVIPVYNSSYTIGKTIKASLNQNYPGEDLEIIIIDDGSTDNTKEVIRQYSVKYIYQKRTGPSRARNSGWKQAKGEIICFTDADCIPEQDWVSKLVKNYTSDKIAVVGGSYGIINKESLLASCIHQEIMYRHSKMSRYVRALGSYNLSVRKKTLEEIGGFNEEYRMASGEDNDLCYKILKKGYDLIFDRDIKVSHYHPHKLLPYLKSQFWHGFWRIKLYIDHPDMVKGDDYSDVRDYIQPFLSLIILCLIPFSFVFPLNLILLIVLFSELLLQLTVSLLIVKRTKRVKYLMFIPIAFLRGFARGLGMLSGVWGCFVIRIAKAHG